MNYTITLVSKINPYDDFLGFVPEFCEEQFDADNSIQTLSHDLFEHWFEGTKVFSTKELSVAGECVAMGIRDYLDCNSGIVQTFMGFNRYHGVEWNSFSNVLGLLSEEDYVKDFNYTPLFKTNNRYSGTFRAYTKDEEDLRYEQKVEQAMSYGYEIGRRCFQNQLNEVYDFLAVLRGLLKKNILPNSESPIEDFEIQRGLTFTLKKGTKNIVGNFSNGIIIKPNSNINNLFGQWEDWQHGYE